MKKLLLTTACVLCSAGIAFAVPIDLSSWTQEGPAGNGTWAVSVDHTNVLQTINGNPTYFVSDSNYINTTFNGSFGVEGSGDDDYIGFVFGYNNQNDFLLFDWKKAYQPYGGSIALEGFTLSKISGSDVDFWNHAGSNLEVLASNNAPGTGWVDNTPYDFTLDYTTTSIDIAINGTAIFSVTGTFNDGRFGFYNYSQDNVRYQGFTQQASSPVPEPATMLLFGTGLAGLIGCTRMKRKKK